MSKMSENKDQKQQRLSALTVKVLQLFETEEVCISDAIAILTVARVIMMRPVRTMECSSTVTTPETVDYQFS